MTPEFSLVFLNLTLFGIFQLTQRPNMPMKEGDFLSCMVQMHRNDMKMAFAKLS